MINHGFKLSTEQLHKLDVRYGGLFDTYTAALRLGFINQARKIARTLDGLSCVAQNLAYDDNRLGESN
ncbi:MAG: hypothetical protein IIA87_02310 [Nanoarchaeota archaeon]|nr:hypothetical protein [Nanoarchaeota archaeon]